MSRVQVHQHTCDTGNSVALKSCFSAGEQPGREGGPETKNARQQESLSLSGIS